MGAVTHSTLLALVPFVGAASVWSVCALWLFFEGHTTAAIGLAVLDVLRDEGLQERAREVGQHLRAGLEALLDRHRAVGDVRELKP